MNRSILTKSAYIPQLDALRFFAVLLVMIEHWLPGAYAGKYWVGPTGVLFFFVLSGYLITGNLFSAKRARQQQTTSGIFILKQFYLRRILRIVPIYYLVVFAVLLIPGVGATLRKDLGWYLTFLNNWSIYFQRSWGPVGHTWTLAVEEQFYLLWPFLVLFVSNRHVWKWFMVMILFSILARELVLGQAYLHHPADWKQGFDAILTPYYFDAFGLGALLAYQKQFAPIDAEQFKRLARIVLGISAVSWIIILGVQPVRTLFFSGYILIPLTSVGVIFFASSGIGGLVGRVLNNKALIFLGRISYGMYLYHYLAAMVWFIVGDRLLSLPEPSLALRFLAYFAITVSISWVSWIAIEHPLLRLKKYLRYSKSPEHLKAEVAPQ